MKHVLNLLLFILIFISPSYIVAQQDTIIVQREARSLLREGNELYNKEQFTDASVAYKKALEKNNNYNKASYNLGNALYQEKNYKEAVPQFELTTKTAKDKFTKAEAYHNIGNAMMEQKEYEQAVNAYKNSLRNNPNDDETRYNLAVVQKMIKKQGGGGDSKDKNKDKKNKDKDKNQQKENNKDKNKKDKNKDQQEGGKDKDKKEGEDGKQDQKQQNNEGKKDPKQQPKPQQGKLSAQQIKQLLESLNNEENKTQKKINANKSKGKKIKQEKDW